MNRWAVLAGVYATVGLIFGGVATYLRGDALVHPAPWLELTPFASHLYSTLLGLTVGLLVVALTASLVKKAAWARTLSAELRPLVMNVPPGGIVVLALFSSLGEELLFRSVLMPATNLWIQALVFGLAHQLPGRARFTWALWATIMGLVFGVLFQATGSLLGPVLAHAVINGMNARLLSSQPTPTSPRALGGILSLRT